MPTHSPFSLPSFTHLPPCLKEPSISVSQYTPFSSQSDHLPHPGWPWLTWSCAFPHRIFSSFPVLILPMLPESLEDASISTNEVFPPHTAASVPGPGEAHSLCSLLWNSLVPVIRAGLCISHLGFSSRASIPWGQGLQSASSCVLTGLVHVLNNWLSWCLGERSGHSAFNSTSSPNSLYVVGKYSDTLSILSGDK